MTEIKIIALNEDTKDRELKFDVYINGRLRLHECSYYGCMDVLADLRYDHAEKAGKL